jgi:predicted HTH domain antitoxin
MGVTRLEFLELLRRRGIPFVQYTAEGFPEDLALMRELEEPSTLPAFC